MALVKCSECLNQISDAAKNCPKCGAPVNLEKIKQELLKENKNKKGCFLFLVGAILLSLIYSSINDASTPEPISETIPVTTDSTETKLHDQLIKNAEEAQKIEDAKFLKTKAGKIYKNHSEWSKEDCIKVSKNQIWIGMSYDMLIYERGKPNTVNTSNYGNGNEYQCCWDNYTPRCFYMKEDQIINSYN